MRYQLADALNGTFGAIYESREAAEAELSLVIAEGQAHNDAVALETGEPAMQAADFFYIVGLGDDY